MKKLLLIVRLFIFVLLNVCCAKLFRFVLDDDSIAISRYMMHDLYSETENIDVLFLGTSHSFCSLDPEITDEVFGMNTFNAGSQSQDLDGSLALLKEANKHHDIKKVYLEMYFDHSRNEEYSKRTELERVWVISDYMKPSFNKLDLLIHGVPKDYFVCTAVVARRNWSGLFEPGKVLDLIKTKLSGNYINYEFCDPEGKQHYHKKGYYYTNEVAPLIAVMNYKGSIKREEISDSWRTYLHKIIDYCDENDIELTLYSAPMQDYLLNALGNYDEYIAIVNHEIEGTDVKYYDFNLCKRGYYDNKRECYMDAGHLNRVGSSKFSRIFSEFFTGQIDKADLFFDSYADKMALEKPQVFCLMRQGDIDETNSSESFMIIASCPNNMEYRIYWDDGNTKTMLRDYSQNLNIRLPIGVAGKCTIDYKNADYVNTWTADLPEGL